MSQQPRPRNEALSNLSDLKEQARLLVKLCLSSPSAAVNSDVEKLLSKQPSIFTILQQPFLKEMRQQLIAIAHNSQQTTLAASLSQDTITTPEDLFPTRQRDEFIDSFLDPLKPFTNSVIKKLGGAALKNDSKTFSKLLPLLDDQSFQSHGHIWLLSSVMHRCPPIVALLTPRLKFETYCANDSERNTALHHAVSSGATDIVELLVQQPNIRSTPLVEGNSIGATPLHYAALTNRITMVRLLLPICNVNARSIHGSTALYEATKHGNVEMVKELLDAGADIMLGDIKEGSNPLHFACQKGFIDIVRLFLAKLSPAQITKKMGKNSNALTLAAGHFHVEVTTLLLPYFPLPDKIDLFKRLLQPCQCPVPVHRDQQFNMVLNIIKSLDNIPAKLDRSYMEILFKAIREERLEAITVLLSKIPKQKIYSPVFLKDHTTVPMSPLHLAAGDGKLQALKLLAAPLTADEINHNLLGAGTPLFQATQSGSLDTVFFLVMKLRPEQINIPMSESDTTTLDMALHKKSRPITRLLLNRIPAEDIFKNLSRIVEHINCPCCSGQRRSEAFLAHFSNLVFLLGCINEQKSFPECLEDLYLCIIGISIQKDLSDLLPLVIPKIPPAKLFSHVPRFLQVPVVHLAIYQEKLKFLQQLISGLSPKQITCKAPDTDVTPLYAAAEQGHLASVELLLDKTLDEDLMTICEDYFSALHIAIDKGHTEVARVLINRIQKIPGALSLRHPPDNESPLFLAVESNDEDIVALLLSHLKNPDDIHAPDRDNDTPLHLAAENGNLTLAKSLLVEGTLPRHINHLNNQGYTPLMTAIVEGETAIAALLIDQLASAEALNFSSKKHGSPLDMAIKAGNLEIIQKLIQVPGLLSLTAPSVAEEAQRRCNPDSSPTPTTKPADEQKKSKATRLSFEKRWEAIAEGSRLPVARKARHRPSLFKSLALNLSPTPDLLSLPAGSSKTTSSSSGLDAKAAFFQATNSLPRLPATDQLSANHYYLVKKFPGGKEKMMLHLSDAVVKQAQDQGVWEDLQKFLNRPAGIHFVGQGRKIQGLKKLQDSSTWELTMRSDVLGDVRLFTAWNTEPTKAVTPEGETVSIMQLERLGSHADLRPQSASSSR